MTDYLIRVNAEGEILVDGKPSGSVVVPKDLVGIIRSLGYTTMRQSLAVKKAIFAARPNIAALAVKVPKRRVLPPEYDKNYPTLKNESIAGFNKALDELGIKP